MGEVVQNNQIYHHAKFEHLWTSGRSLFYISKLKQSSNNWKKVVHRIGPSPCLQYLPSRLKQSELTGRTAAARTHRPCAACPNRDTARAAVSPLVPTGSHRPRLCAAHVHRPPSTASTGYTGSSTPCEQPFFLPPITPTAPPCSTAVKPPCSTAPGPPPSSQSPP
jgi:hypothetical protein